MKAPGLTWIFLRLPFSCCRGKAPLRPAAAGRFFGLLPGFLGAALLAAGGFSAAAEETAPSLAESQTGEELYVPATEGAAPPLAESQTGEELYVPAAEETAPSLAESQTGEELYVPSADSAAAEPIFISGSPSHDGQLAAGASVLEGFSLELESSVRLSKNRLLSSPSAFRTEIPYSEITFSRMPSRGAGARFGVELLCGGPRCRMGLEEFFGSWRQPLGRLSWMTFGTAFGAAFLRNVSQSVEWRAGWLKYPLPYLERNRKEISKAVLLRQALPINEESGAGASMRWTLSGPEEPEAESAPPSPSLGASGPSAPRKSLTLEAAAFLPRTEMPAYSEFKADRRPMIFARLEGAGPFGHVFAGFLRRHPFQLSRSRGGASQALGAGGQALYESPRIFGRSLSLSLRGEAWGIQRAAPWEMALAGYVFPQLKYGRLGLGFLYGGSRAFYPKQPPGGGGLQMPEAEPASERLLQITWDFSESLAVYWEAFIEEDSLLRQKAWTLSLKAGFALF